MTSAPGRAASTTPSVDDAGTRQLVRAVRRPAAAAGARPGARRAADEHVAGLQLRGRGLVVLRPERPHRRARRARTSTAACRRTTTATTAASSAGSRSTTSSRTSSPTTTSTASRRLPQLARDYDLIVFSGHEEYVTDARVRPDRGLPRSRRQPRVPVGERLLLQGRSGTATRSTGAGAGATSAGPRRRSSARSTSTGTTASTPTGPSPSPASQRAPWLFAGTGLARRLALRRLRDRGRRRRRRTRRPARACSRRSTTSSVRARPPR